MKEAYCSYEISKILKEKGFDEECTHYYSYEDDELIEYTNGVYSRNSKDCHRCASPTQQMACAWLREKGFEIGVFYLFKAINSDVTVFDGYIPNVTQVIDGVYKDSWDMDVVKDYNDAVETALKYVLENLI